MANCPAKRRGSMAPRRRARAPPLCTRNKMSDSQLLVSYCKSVLYPCDLLSLLPGAWIGDAVLSFFFDHLSSAAPPSAVLLPPSTCSIILHGSDAEELRADLGALCARLATADLVLLPVIDGSADAAVAASGAHWTLLAWRRGRGFSHANPCGAGGSNLANARVMAAHVHPLLMDARGASAGAAVAEAPSVEAQAGGADCGAHVMQNAEAALGGGAPPPVGTYRRRVWELAASLAYDEAARAWFAARTFPAP